MTKWIFFAGLLTSSLHAQAGGGDAGCGLGSMIIQKNSQVLQLFAMTTNHSFLTQPLGITSGTSNCASSGLVMREKAVQYYVEVNQKDLGREMAQGHGERLATLASLYGCEGSSQQKFAEMTQNAFGEILPNENTSADEMAANLNRQFQSQLKHVCKAQI